MMILQQFRVWWFIWFSFYQVWLFKGLICSQFTAPGWVFRNSATSTESLAGHCYGNFLFPNSRTTAWFLCPTPLEGSLLTHPHQESPLLGSSHQLLLSPARSVVKSTCFWRWRHVLVTPASHRLQTTKISSWFTPNPCSSLSRQSYQVSWDGNKSRWLTDVP